MIKSGGTGTTRRFGRTSFGWYIRLGRMWIIGRSLRYRAFGVTMKPSVRVRWMP